MDALMQASQAKANEYQTWDYAVQDGIVPIIEGSLEDQQASVIAAFLQRGTIPQLPATGVRWVEYFTGDVQFNDVDGDIKTALNNIGLTTFYPTYDLINDKLVTKVAQL